MLANARRDDRLTLGVFVDFLNHRVRLNEWAVTVVIEAVLFLERGDFLVPRGKRFLEAYAAPVLEHVGEVRFQNADVVPVDSLDLANFRKVDVKLRNVFRVWRELWWVGGYAVIEPGTDGDNEIAIFNSVVCGCNAVHAKHVQCQRISCIARAERHQCRRDRNAVFVGQLSQGLGRVCVDNAAARINQRSLGL